MMPISTTVLAAISQRGIKSAFSSAALAIVAGCPGGGVMSGTRKELTDTSLDLSGTSIWCLCAICRCLQRDYHQSNNSFAKVATADLGGGNASFRCSRMSKYLRKLPCSQCRDGLKCTVRNSPTSLHRICIRHPTAHFIVPEPAKKVGKFRHQAI